MNSVHDTLQRLGVIEGGTTDGLNADQLNELNCIAEEVCFVIEEFCEFPEYNDRDSVADYLHDSFICRAAESDLSDILDDVIDLAIYEYEDDLFPENEEEYC